MPEPDALPPRLEAPGEFAILAARSFDIPFSFSFSYCFSLLTLGRFPGMRSSFAWTRPLHPKRARSESRCACSGRETRTPCGSSLRRRDAAQGRDVDVLVRGRLTTLRPADAGDVDRLVAWHADPDVSRYWDGETFTHDEMAERLSRAEVEAWIVEESGEPVGYLQVHRGGLDMFLIPAVRGRGLGPDAARAMARHLVGGRGFPRVTVDPYAWNEGAVRAWERAGFVEVSRHEADEDHTASWILMEFRD
jgi:aminoglycoside 6'-N-acetyltransferase